MTAPVIEALLSRSIDHAGQLPPTAREIDNAFTVAARFPKELAFPNLIAANMVLKLAQLGEKSTDALKDHGLTPDNGLAASILAEGTLEIRKTESFLAQLDRVNAFNEEHRAAKILQSVASLDIPHSADCSIGCCNPPMADNDLPTLFV